MPTFETFRDARNAATKQRAEIFFRQHQTRVLVCPVFFLPYWCLFAAKNPWLDSFRSVLTAKRSFAVAPQVLAILKAAAALWDPWGCLSRCGVVPSVGRYRRSGDSAKD